MASRGAQHAIRLRGVAAAALILGLASCEQVIGIPDRATRHNVDCVAGSCACAAGFGDCDGNAANGCETALAMDQNNCGACGAVCANGLCGDGACTCEAGFTDCDTDPKNGCEAELAVSSTSCGTCGHDCLGGSCAASLCGAATVASFTSIGQFVLADGTIYYTANTGTDGQLLSVPAVGGVPTLLQTFAGEPVYPLGATPGYIAVAGKNNLYRVDRASNARQLLFTTPLQILEIAPTGDRIFVELLDAGAPSEIDQVDANTGMSTVVSTDLAFLVAYLTIAGGEPYWLDSQGTVSTVIGGVGQPMPNSPTDAWDLAGDADNLFVILFGSGSGDNPFTRIHLPDGAMTTTGTLGYDYYEKGAYGDALYWFDSSGSAFFRTDDQSTTTISQPGLALESGSGLQVDDLAVYSTTTDAIVRVVR